MSGHLHQYHRCMSLDAPTMWFNCDTLEEANDWVATSPEQNFFMSVYIWMPEC